MKPLKFIHITKNAGTSIENIANKKNYKWGRFDQSLSFLGRVFWHQPFQFCHKEAHKKMIINKFDLFAVVRHPYDRCVSEYFCRWGGPRGNVTRTKEHMNNYIQDKVRKVKNKKEILGRNIWRDLCYGHFIPQFYYIYDGKGCKMVKHILKFEELQTQFNQLMKRYKIPLELDRHDNVNKRNLSVDDLTQETKDLIYTVYERDFREFGYLA